MVFIFHLFFSVFPKSFHSRKRKFRLINLFRNKTKFYKIESIEKMMGDKEAERHWADTIAEKLILLNPKKKKFVCAAGISPSGTVHIGNFRDVITADLVVKALKDRKKQAELIFSWDEFDRLRKIPGNIPQRFSVYLGMPLAEIPDPYKCHSSYAKHFEADFEKILPEFGIDIRFIHQADMYRKNKYYEGIKIAMEKRKEIAKILARFKTQGMTEEKRENYYPLQIYCTKCKSSLNTKIMKYEGNEVTYYCKCGQREKIDISKKNIGKLDWKVDWAMRWKYEDVVFEPGGEDHAAPGGSYDVSSVIAREIYEIEPPLFQGYGFVGVEGAFKMSSSTGTGISPKDLLEIYEPELLRWLFVRAKPLKPITLFFGSQIIRQYDEFDQKVIDYYSKKISDAEKREIEFSKTKKTLAKTRIPFRQIASFGQIVQGNFSELKKMYDKLGEKYDEKALKERLEKTQVWIEKFNPEMKIKIRETPNESYFRKLSKEEKEQIIKLKEKLKDIKGKLNIEKLTALVYDIPKKPSMSDEKKKTEQRRFFKNVYQMLMNTDTGPRLPTFLLALEKEKVEKLLDIKL
jgi:lysyl-tRNA synthetase class 1